MCGNNTRMHRRRVMKFIVAGIGGAVAFLMGIPVMLSGMSPVMQHQKNRRENWKGLGKVTDFPTGLMTSASIPGFMEKGVYVWRSPSDELIIFSRSCTDLGCPVKWDSGSECFFCPCHGGIFSKEGDRMAGPPKKPLYRYKYRVLAEVVEVDVNSVPLIA